MLEEAAAGCSAAGLHGTRATAAHDQELLPAAAPEPLGHEAMERLLAINLPDLAENERAGWRPSPKARPDALMLAEEEGLAIAGLVDGVLGALPGLKTARAYAVADTLGRGENAFSNFMDLLRAGIAAAVRDVVRGRADEEQSRLVALRPLDAWGDVWHALTRLQDETERFALDKRKAIVAGLGMLSGNIQ